MHQPDQTIELTVPDRNLYSVLQQEVDLGVQALGEGNADVAVTLFESALQKLTADQPFYDHLVHNLLLSFKLLIEQLMKAERVSEAARVLHRALDLEVAGEMASDARFRKRFAGVFEGLGLLFFKNRHFRASVLCLRKAMDVCPRPGAHVNLTNSLAAAGERAVLADFTSDITPDELGRHIFIACVPKSASTFLKNLLVNLTGYRDIFMVYAAGQNEHELYLPTLRDAAHLDTVTQQHCRASDANVHMMQGFEIRPVVLVRNVFDSAVSLLDFYNNGAYFTSYFRADFERLDEETKIDLLIDNIIPWYFQFVASWDLVEKRGSLEVMWLTYEDLIRDKPTCIGDVLKFYGLGASLRSVEQKIRETASEERGIRFNKGIAGRGDSGLSDRQKAKIRRLARYYPTTDFSRIGL